MAVTIDYATKSILVPRDYMEVVQLAPTEVRRLDLNVFRLELKSLEDDSDGMAFERTHSHTTGVSVSGAILARVVQIINGYTVTFEDGQYAVNLVGANSNVADVVNVNQVSVRTANSAGLVDLSTLLGGISEADIATIASAIWDKQLNEHAAAGSAGKQLKDSLKRNAYIARI